MKKNVICRLQIILHDGPGHRAPLRILLERFFRSTERSSRRQEQDRDSGGPNHRVFYFQTPTALPNPQKQKGGPASAEPPSRIRDPVSLLA
jgi:hypothetical protein